jgi:sodium-dependent dicarboxylate transporter 2/3/5
MPPGNETMAPMAAIAALMAIWWIAEAIPIPATALLPVVLFPCFKIMNGKDVSALYFNHLIFLFMGGFIIALAIEKWNLHRRVALGIIALIGSRPRQIVLGFMSATAFLSMWISNTATTMMMLPIAMSVIEVVRKPRDEGPIDPALQAQHTKRLDNFSVTLMLAIAYAASIGGISTIIGTPPNVVFTGIYDAIKPESAESISFVHWMLMAFPLSLTFLFIAWFMLTYVIFPTGRARFFDGDGNVIHKEREKLGTISVPEFRVLLVFLATVLLWFFRKNIDLGFLKIPGWSNAMGLESFVNDGTAAIAMALLLFIIPSGKGKSTMLMNWETAVKLPWGILLLFGGGFALAGGFTASGLSEWLGQRLAFVAPWGTPALVASISTMMTFLTELTSNAATTSMLLPILASVAEAIEVDPLLLMIPATLSASFAFMLPVATPPNAIVFASGYIPMRKMAWAGIILNVIGIVLSFLTVMILTRPIFGL